MSHAVDLSVLIVSWNTRDLLRACLLSVAQDLASAPLAAEVFVVDNASTDDSVAMLAADFPWVRVVENRHNGGFAAGNNQALALAHGRFLLLLNPDTVVQPGSLAALVGFLDHHAQAGVVGARLLNADGTLQPSCSPRPTVGREVWRLFHLDRIIPWADYPMQRWPLDQAREVDVVQGAAFCVRQTVVDQVGVLNTDYFMYSEEVDWCYRIQRAGWKIYWAPTAAVIHYGGQSSRQAATSMFLQLYRGKIVYFRTHDGVTSARLYKLGLAAATVGRLLVSPLALLESGAQRARHLTLARHYLRLLASLPGL